MAPMAPRSAAPSWPCGEPGGPLRRIGSARAWREEPWKKEQDLSFLYIYIYIHVCLYVCIYLYLSISLYLNIYIYIYIYVHMLHVHIYRLFNQIEPDSDLKWPSAQHIKRSALFSWQSIAWGWCDTRGMETPAAGSTIRGKQRGKWETGRGVWQNEETTMESRTGLCFRSATTQKKNPMFGKCSVIRLSSILLFWGGKHERDCIRMRCCWYVRNLFSTVSCLRSQLQIRSQMMQQLSASSLCKTCKTLGKVHFSSHNHISLECAGAPVPAPYSRNWINFGKISIPSYRIPVPKEHGKQEEESPGFPNKHHTMGRRKHYPCKSGSVLIALYP